jgi:oligoendopeptidase F
MNPFQETAAIFNRAIDQAAKPQETVIERASRAMADNQREIERLTHELAQAKQSYASAVASLPKVLTVKFEFEKLIREQDHWGPAEYTTKIASPDIVLDCVNALLEKHDDELMEMVREAQLKAWER